MSVENHYMKVEMSTTLYSFDIYYKKIQLFITFLLATQFLFMISFKTSGEIAANSAAQNKC